MGRLIYSLSVSLDGFAAAADGSLDWVRMDEELHAQFNEEGRQVGTSLYGRRMYELMAGYWPSAEDDPASTPIELEWARIWKATPKVVFSQTLEAVGWNSRLVRGDAVAEVTRLKVDGPDMDVGGPALAGALLGAGLVDELRLYISPVVLGAGLPFFPAGTGPLEFRLVETRTFGSGVVQLRYEAVRPTV